MLSLALVLLFSMIPASTLSAGEIEFELTASRSVVSPGQRIKLNLQFNDTRDIPAPDLPEIEGFNLRYIGPSTRMSFVNGRMSSSITHTYSLVPLKTGKIKIGPFSLEHNGDTYISNELTIEIVDSSQGQHPATQRRSSSDASHKDNLFLTMKAEKSEMYINEIVPLTIKLYVSGLRVRDIQYPEFNHEGFSSEQSGKPKQYKEQRGGTVYSVVEFNTSIFGTKAGKLDLGPAVLEANIIVQRNRRNHSYNGQDPFESIFGSQNIEPVRLSSEALTVKVLPLPKDRRPSGYNGAVGNFSINVNISPAQVKAGDPLTMKMIVTGTGNLNTVMPPKLENMNNFKTYEPQTSTEGEKKVFEQVLIPLDDSVKEVPVIAFSFFNTATGQYETISKGPFPVRVTIPDSKEEITILEATQSSEKHLKKEIFGRDIIYIKESPGSLKQKGVYLYKNTLFLFLNIVPLLVFFGAWRGLKQREKISTDIGYARRLVAPKKAKKGIRNSERHLHKNSTTEFYDSIFKTIREYIGDRFHIPSGGITSDIVDDTMQDRIGNKEVLSKLKDILIECDMARYAPAELNTANMEKTLAHLKEVIDYMERHK